MTYLATIEKIYASIAEGDFEPIFDNLSPTALWIEAENIPYSPGEPIVGHAEVQAAVFDKLPNDFTDFHLDVTRIVAADTTLLVEGRYVGKTNTGNSLDAIFAHVWDFDGDQIVRFQQYSDTWQWRQVLGADA
jgi:ketosteroid isomerase-like protein